MNILTDVGKYIKFASKKDSMNSNLGKFDGGDSVNRAFILSFRAKITYASDWSYDKLQVKGNYIVILFLFSILHIQIWVTGDL